MAEQQETEGSVTANPGSRKSIVIAVVFAVGAVLWVGSGLIEDEPVVETRTAGDRLADASEPVRVQVMNIAAQDRPRRVVVTGRTDAIESAEIKAETAGRVVARPARKGEHVDAGTVLLELAMDDRGAKLRDAEASVESAEIQYNAAKDLQRKQFESQVRLAESSADLADARADLEAARLDIRRTKIRAPFDGFVEDIGPTVGDFVIIEDHVATVVDLDPLRVVINVTEQTIGGVAVDDLVSVRLPDGRELGGTVHFVSRVANEVTRTFRVDIHIDNPDERIAAGLTAEVALSIGNRPAHKLAKSALTLDDRGILGVRGVDDGDVVRFFPVTLLDDTPDGVWVAGLPDTVRVIMVGQEFVIEGQTVAPVDMAASNEGTSS